MTVALAASIVVLTLFASDAGDVDWGGRATDQDFEIEGVRDDIGSHPGASTVSTTPREYLRDDVCWYTDGVMPASLCGAAPAPPFVCASGAIGTDPLWMREQLADGTWGPWVVLTWYGCPSEADLLAAIEREWTELRPEPTRISFQPDTGVVYATVPTVAIADDSTRLHAAQILGAAVTIRATPARFTWTWGDGESTTTTDPGRPYPNATVTHAYGRALDSASVSLTTTWTGEYRIGAGTWADFDTSIATTSPAVSLQVLHPRSVLVAGPAS